jgi:steroid 5-alpha reductase family enzyme
MDILYKISLTIILGLSVIVFILLFHITAPYGKFLRKGWGPVIRSKWAWMIMEFPSPALMLTFFIISGNKTLVQSLFITLWLLHYVHRTFVYPFIQSGREKDYPTLLVLMAFVFNCLNGFANGYGVFYLSPYDYSYLSTWKFITGSFLFLAGFIINRTSDSKLRILRRTNHSGYVIPRGWLFEYVSNPHYMGEIIEWCGWAVMTWSLPGFAFALFTFANLYPRAVASHKWYKKQFPDYPPGRNPIFPI